MCVWPFTPQGTPPPVLPLATAWWGASIHHMRYLISPPVVTCINRHILPLWPAAAHPDHAVVKQGGAVAVTRGHKDHAVVGCTGR